VGKTNPIWCALSISGLISCLLSVTSTFTHCSPVSPHEEPRDSIQNTHADSIEFQQLLDTAVSEGIPGVVLFVQTPQGRWNGAAGYAKIETSTRMLPTHIHDAASVTKIYTAAAVMLLVEDSVLELDAKISRYLPESRYDSLPNGTTATVRQLLDHTSGIPDFSGAPNYMSDFYNDPMGEYPLERLLGYIYEQSPVGPAGTVYSYSNANYLLLALIMDYSAGSHAKIISERILKPLGLTATYYKNEAGFPRPPGMVDCYQYFEGDSILTNITDFSVHGSEIFMGNAGLMASSADFARFIQYLLGGRIVGQESLTAMRDSGLGLDGIETEYGKAIGRSGDDFGAMIQVWFFPDKKSTIVLLMNGGDSGNLGNLFRNLWNEVLIAALSEV
jgi:D-alanyl-D-alanine carboxypeptidase